MERIHTFVYGKYTNVFRPFVRQIPVLLGFDLVLYRAHTRKTKSLMSPKKTNPSL